MHDRADAATHDALCARLRGEDVPLSAAMAQTARHHRVHLILAAAARPDRGQREGKDAVLASLVAELRRAALVDIVRERMLRSLLDRFASADIDSLLLKGAGLAYTLYQSPYLRPRSDLDVLIPHAALERAEAALAAGGLMRVAETDGELVTTQRHYVLRDPEGFNEQVDLHWKIANPQLFRDSVSFEELLSRSVPVAALGPRARTLSMPDALFVACLHRVAHHQDEVDLLWLWDVHLLVSRLSEQERARFAELAAQRSMRTVCAKGLELARARFSTAGAADLIAALRQPAGEPAEASSRFLDAGLRQVDVLRSDLLALHGWRERLALIREHMFPPVAYMQSIYPGRSRAMLPLAYVHRIARGASKWFRRPPRIGAAE